MQWIIDHLAALLIACTIIFMLAVLNLRGQDSAIDTVQFHAARTATIVLTEVLEQDLMNIGAGKVQLDSDDIIVNKATTPHYLQFLTLSDRAARDTVVVRYTWEEAGTVDLRNTTVATFHVTRSVNGSAFPISGNTITAFDVATLEQVGTSWQPTSNPRRIKRIDVDLTLISPLGAANTVEETRWNRQVMPVNLRNNNGWILLRN